MHDYLTIMLEEYKTIRGEILQSIGIQLATVRFGFTVFGIVLASGLAFWDREVVPEIIFLVFLPFLVWLVLLVWAGELSRMIRAGHYISALERKLNHALSKDALKWENYISRKVSSGRSLQHGVLYPSHVVIIILFALSAILSIIIGCYRLLQYASSSLFGTAILVEITVSSVIIYLASRKIRFYKHSDFRDV